MIQYKKYQTDRYVLDCKYFLPEDGEVFGIAIGVHGFAGDKESSVVVCRIFKIQVVKKAIAFYGCE